MIKAVLLDLDNTLLYNPDNVFVGQYLQLVDEYFQTVWQFPQLSKVLLQSMKVMAGAHDLWLTNTEVATEVIAQATARSTDEVINTFSEFYDQAYPQLHKYVEPLGSLPQKLIAYAREKKYALVVATNPIYPAEAIRQRLAWAGIPDNFECYTLVTHAENMHFIKPSPSYYAEIVARVGVEPDEAIMVGDNFANDIAPAQQVGVHVYPVESATLVRSPRTDKATLGDFFEAFSSEGWAEEFPPRNPVREMIAFEMRGNLGALFGTLADAKAHHWTQHPDPNEWSPIQIVCHLLESETKVQRPRLERIAAEDNPFLVALPPPPGPRDAQPCDDDGFRVAQRFAEARQQTLDWLQTLQSDDWNRPARHSIFGPTTFVEMAHFTAQHDRLHINQLCQTLGRCQ